MLFLSFHSQEERRAYGSSAFLELQFCRLPAHMSVKERVTVEHIRHWQNDSLYVADENKFCREYGHIFGCGIYNNLKSGPVDPYGINYYPPTCIDTILKQLLLDQPSDYEMLVHWLEKAKPYNGFYILGI